MSPRKPRQDLQWAGEVELGEFWEDDKADIEERHV